MGSRPPVFDTCGRTWSARRNVELLASRMGSERDWGGSCKSCALASTLDLAVRQSSRRLPPTVGMDSSYFRGGTAASACRCVVKFTATPVWQPCHRAPTSSRRPTSTACLCSGTWRHALAYRNSRADCAAPRRRRARAGGAACPASAASFFLFLPAAGRAVPWRAQRASPAVPSCATRGNQGRPGKRSTTQSPAGARLWSRVCAPLAQPTPPQPPQRGPQSERCDLCETTFPRTPAHLTSTRAVVCVCERLGAGSGDAEFRPTGNRPGLGGLLLPEEIWASVPEPIVLGFHDSSVTDAGGALPEPRRGDREWSCTSDLEPARRMTRCCRTRAGRRGHDRQPHVRAARLRDAPSTAATCSSAWSGLVVWHLGGAGWRLGPISTPCAR